MGISRAHLVLAVSGGRGPPVVGWNRFSSISHFSQWGLFMKAGKSNRRGVVRPPLFAAHLRGPPLVTPDFLLHSHSRILPFASRRWFLSSARTRHTDSTHIPARYICSQQPRCLSPSQNGNGTCQRLIQPILPCLRIDLSDITHNIRPETTIAAAITTTVRKKAKFSSKVCASETAMPTSTRMTHRPPRTIATPITAPDIFAAYALLILHSLIEISMLPSGAIDP